MIRRFWLASVAAALGCVALAQDPAVQPPTTPVEFYRAAQYEISIGKYDLAAQYLKGLNASEPKPEDLLAIESDRGLSALLSLRNVPRWINDPSLKDEDRQRGEKEARQAVESLIEKTTAALKARLSDAARINRFIGNLSPNAQLEEREYAIRELQRSGSLAMPYLIDAARTREDRAVVLQVLPLLGEDIVPALLAALDAPETTLRAQLIDALARRRDVLQLPNRAETDPTPAMVYLSASPAQPSAVRQAAANLLQRLRPVSPGRFPSPKVDLAAAADRYYRHQARFTNPQAVPVWYFADNKLQQATANASQAEEYFGLRFARWALELDPSYEPAQVIFLSLAVDKAFERTGLDKPLSVSSPAVNDLLGTASTPALVAGLERALAENRVPALLGFVQALDNRSEASAGRPGRTRPGPLVRALDYPERRVQLAAAIALLHLPGRVEHQAQARIVDVLTRSLALDGEGNGMVNKPKAVLAHTNSGLSLRQAEAIQQAGYQAPEQFSTGLELMRRLKAAGDVDAIFIDADIVYPTLPDLLASLRYDRHLGGLPVYVLTDLLPPTPADVQRDMSIIVEGQYEAELRKVADAVAARFLPDARRDLRRFPQDAVLMKRLAALEQRRIGLSPTIEIAMPYTLSDDRRRALQLDSQTRLRDVYGKLLSELNRQLIRDGKPENQLYDRILPLELEFALRDEVAAISARLAQPSAVSLTGRRVVLDYDRAVQRPANVARVRRLTEGYRNVHVIDGPLDVVAAKLELQAAQANPTERPLSAAEKADARARALRELKRIALGEIPGYDIKPASAAIVAALADETLANDAADTLGRLPGRDAQLALANAALDGQRKPALRALAAENLVRHIRAFGNALGKDQTDGFVTLLGAEGTDPALRSRVGAVIGAIQGGTTPTVERMRNYLPPLPGGGAPAAATPPAAPPVEDKDK